MTLSKLLRRAPRFLRKGRVPIVIAMALAVFGTTQTSLFRGFAPFQKLEQQLIDSRFHARGNMPGHPDIVIVGLTQSSFDAGLLAKLAGESEAIQLMETEPWPWNRRVFALLIERLLQLGAKVVVVDVLFPGGREGNPDLAAVLTAHRDRVVLGSTLQLEDNDRTRRGQTFILPEPSLVGDDGAVGYCFLRPEVDGVIRRISYRTSDLREFGLDDDSKTLIALAALGVERFTGETAPAGYDQLINYQGPATTYPYLPIEEVFADSIFLRDPKFQGGTVFKDKLVFVGPVSEVQFHDVHATPYGLMPGVEIHAQIAGALLHRANLRDSAPSVNWWVTVALVALPAGTVLLIRNALAQVAALLATGVAFFVISQLLFTHDHLALPMVPPLFGLVVTGGVGVVFHFLIEQLERARVRSILDKYVSKNVANLVVEQGDAFTDSLQGQKRAVTVLFSDIRGFTTLSEAAEPGDLVGQLNEYFHPMVNAVLERGGTLQKFIGDAIMAVWGDTHTRGAAADARAAVETALRMRSALAGLNSNWENKPARTRLSCGIGINHGDVIVGEVGHPHRMEFTVLGDGVNLAARLESATKQFQCDLLVGEKAEALTRPDFVYRQVDLLRFKGKTHPVEVFIPLSDVSIAAPGWLVEYHRGIAAYRSRDFAGAGDLFKAVQQEIGGDDFLCRMYAERCAKFLAQSPPADWDGAHTLLEK